jgi:ATP-binding cassette, subfamily B, bacterial
MARRLLDAGTVVRWLAGRLSAGQVRDTSRLLAREVWRAGHCPAASFWSLTLLLTLVPAGQMAVISVIIGWLPTVIAEGTSSSRMPAFVGALLLLALLYLLGQTAPIVQWSLGRVIGARLETRLRLSVMATALRPSGVGHLDEDTMLQAAGMASETRRTTFGTADAVRGLAALHGGRLFGWIAAGVLATFHWWAPLVLLLTFLPWDAYFRAEFAKMARGWHERNTDQDRATYLRDLGTDAAAGKELRIFGLSGFVQERFVAHFLAGTRDQWAARRTDILRFLPRVLLVVAGYAAVFGALGWELAEERQSLMATALYVQMAGQIWRIVPSFTSLSRVSIGAAPIVAAARADRDVAAEPATATRSPAPRSEIRFEDVSFHYPSAARPILSGLSMTIPIGRSTAIVGENGAGKTTLIKLLCRLYEPTSGRITVDGRDVRDFDADSWRRWLSVTFQDFVRYPLSLRDNVASGAGGQLDDREILDLVRRSGAGDLLDQSPTGLDTALSRDVPGGRELSGGQWQKVAVLRALAGVRTGAEVLVLDEPTANLDVRAEALLFEQLLSLTAGVTTLLISHRLANVRRADRIVVLADGAVAEEGTHARLLALGGRYATMFELQAARFREAPAGAPDTPRVEGGVHA